MGDGGGLRVTNGGGLGVNESCMLEMKEGLGRMIPCR